MMSGGGEGGRGGWGQKVLSRPSADSFAVGRRQKNKIILHYLSLKTSDILRQKTTLDGSASCVI
jgi:hypothetical protein